MSRIKNFFVSLGHDFADFWKSQVFWGVVLAAIAAAWQWRRGQFSGSLRENVWSITFPYLVAIGLFLIANIGRTIFRMERKSFRAREYSARRAEVIEERKRNTPQPLEPNLKFRRVYQDRLFVGHTLGGQEYPAVLVEVGNELSEHFLVGLACEVRVHLTYLDAKTEERVHIECPGYWRRPVHDSPNIPVGEGRSFGLAFYRRDDNMWGSTTHGGIQMRGDFLIHATFLAPSGRCLGDVIKFRFKWEGGYTKPTCEHIEVKH